MKIISLALFVLISMNIAIAQSNQGTVNSQTHKVQKKELTSGNFKDIPFFSATRLF